MKMSDWTNPPSGTGMAPSPGVGTSNRWCSMCKESHPPGQHNPSAAADNAAARALDQAQNPKVTAGEDVSLGVFENLGSVFTGSIQERFGRDDDEKGANPYFPHCGYCDPPGSGTCSPCDGTGVSRWGSDEERGKTCKECKGEGTCKHCEGSGYDPAASREDIEDYRNWARSRTSSTEVVSDIVTPRECPTCGQEIGTNSQCPSCSDFREFREPYTNAGQDDRNYYGQDPHRTARNWTRDGEVIENGFDVVSSEDRDEDLEQRIRDTFGLPSTFDFFAKMKRADSEVDPKQEIDDSLLAEAVWADGENTVVSSVPPAWSVPLPEPEIDLFFVK